MLFLDVCSIEFSENVLSSDPRDAGHVPDLTKINEWFDGKEEEPKILFAEDP